MSEGSEAVATARAAAARMWAADRASQAAGVQLGEVGPGRATATLTVTADMIQGHGTCHGGYVFLLADTAFAFACNSDGRPTVAAACDIVFVAPSQEGDVLVADARERVRAGRTGVYDVTVRRSAADGDRDVVAEFRGMARTLAGPMAGGGSGERAEPHAVPVAADGGALPPVPATTTTSPSDRPALLEGESR